HHVEVRVEAAGRYDDGLAADLSRLAGPDVCRADARDTPVVTQDLLGARPGEDRHSGTRLHRANQRRHETQAVAIRTMPAEHAFAFLELEVDPLRAVPFRPEIEIVQRVLDVVAGPRLVGIPAAPCDPVLERQLGRVADPQGFLPWRPHDEAAAAGGRGGSA